MSKTPEEELAEIRSWKAEMTRREAEHLAKMGLSASASEIAKGHREEDEREAVYDRLTPAERMQLFQSNPEEWRRVLDAKEAAGFRKLIFKR